MANDISYPGVPVKLRFLPLSCQKFFDQNSQIRKLTLDMLSSLGLASVDVNRLNDGLSLIV